MLVKKFTEVSLFFIFTILCVFARAESLIVVGKIPGQYLDNRNSNQFFSGYIRIEDRLITDVKAFDINQLESLKSLADQMIVLKNPMSGELDAIYPGLIDLHGHNKQNMVPAWTSALGRFANRYEWRRDSSEYKTVLSDNMNPWSGAEASKVAAYRWSELQAMVLGTTYLQGLIHNHKDFSIHSVEDTDAFISEKLAVQSNGDIVDPFKWSFLWNELRPIMNNLGCAGSFACYKKSLAQFLKNHCQVSEQSPVGVESDIENDELKTQVPQLVIDDVSSDIAVKWLLAAEDVLPQACPDVENSEEMILFLTEKFGNLPHKEVVRRNLFLDDPKRSSIITHIAEGRRLDPETWVEFQLLKLAGLAREGMNFIHGNGLRREDFTHMAQNNMGLIWSPYSNFLLYGETVDIAEAIRAGVTIALGSDWTPTGSKSVLEELRVATDYLSFIGLNVSDQFLYDMVTKNSAIIMNHYGYESAGEHGVGTLETGAMGTLIATTVTHENPFTNLVRHVRAQEVNLVVIDGKTTYGNRSYIEQSQRDYEVISGLIFDQTLEAQPQLFPRSLEPEIKEGSITKNEMGLIVARYAAEIKLTHSTQCDFVEDKVFVLQESKDWENRVQPILQESNLNLDTYSGIARYLGVALLSQGRNVIHDGVNPTINNGAVRVMPHLYGCEDHAYLNGLQEMARAESNTITYMQTQRINLREEQDLLTRFNEERGQVDYSIPHELAILYGFEDPVETPFNRQVIEVLLEE